MHCPDDEQPATSVAERLTVVETGANTWSIDYGGDRPIPLEGWTGAAAKEEGRELREKVDGADGGSDAVRALLDAAEQIFACEMRPHDRALMAWPVAVAAAAWLADRGGGLVHAESDAWLAPTPREVRIVIDERR